MKLLLIILFFLFSSPVIGDNHKGETLYRWFTSSGELWKGFGEKGTHPIYKGDVENGEPNGVGIFITLFGTKYVGEWKDGLYNGQGTETQIDGENYRGEWKDGKKHGQGTYTYSKSVGWGKFVGEYKDGNPWTGILYDEDGNISVKIVNGEQQ